MPQNKSRVQYIIVEADYIGQRIDNFLFNRYKGVPKSHIYRILRKGEIRVNKKRVKAEYRVQLSDSIRIPPLSVSTPTVTVKKLSQNQTSLIENRILYEDNELIVINKPVGMAVHGGSGILLGIIEMLRLLRSNEKNLELVHRLDRDTSGCLLVAKKRSMLRYLHEQLRSGMVKKIYLTLLKDKLKEKCKVTAPLHKNILQSGERIVKVSQEGKPSETLFEPLKIYREATFTKVRIATGRTHQIRVHAAHMEHPVIGDTKYGDKIINKSFAQYGLRRLFLHAHELHFKHPQTQAVLSFNCKLDDELQSVLDQLT